MDGKKIARGGVTVAETLAKYGLIKGLGTVARCGWEAGGVLLKEHVNLTQHFSGCSLDSNIGSFLMSKTQKAVDWSTKKVENGSVFLKASKALNFFCSRDTKTFSKQLF